MTYGPANTQSPYLPTAETFPQDASQLLIKLTSLQADVANAVNVREIAQYEDARALLTGQQFSTPGNSQLKRYSFRKIFYIGAIPTGATVNTPHGITGMTMFTKISGAVVTNAPDYRPLPYTGTGAGDYIAMVVTAANIRIANGPAMPNIVSGVVILEYLMS
jgi:hypothetical protein